MNELNRISISDSTLDKYLLIYPRERQHKLNSVPGFERCIVANTGGEIAEYFASHSKTGKNHAVDDYPIISANGLDNKVCRN